MKLSLESEICKAVQKVGVNVDKDELIKALQYDRAQYQKGYNDRDKEIVRCKDCEFWINDGIIKSCKKHLGFGYFENWFCADGERRTDDG
jgi:Zn-finger nucleic acid-binding protein